MLRALALVSLLALVIPAVARAQETPTADLFPAADAFGDGWVLHTATDGDTSQWPSFDRFSAAIYLGPEGSRVLAGRIQVAEGDAASRDAWALANGMFEQYLGRFSVAPSSDTGIGGTAMVPGCVNSRHANGSDVVMPAIPVGLSLCATDASTIVMVYASGVVGGQDGYDASDDIVGTVLQLPTVGS